MIGFWPEFEDKYFGDNNRRCSRKKEYETYQINKVQVNIFNVKCLGDIATRRHSLFSCIRHDSQRHLQNLKI
ncbi:Protein CBG22809 [Caenorhabditis briggsae]|uniref:Protein CBG22809 n=1 Tax=Caenorhabditis briggsae TaxID=6238 RepID=A8Y341_CAEBR|nr:Protein CBG22809 [Caenorhabditis briggsae]CAP39310.1 Protein CBG22809 [Caenorhabditis briggsae]